MDEKKGNETQISAVSDDTVAFSGRVKLLVQVRFLDYLCFFQCAFLLSIFEFIFLNLLRKKLEELQ